VVSCEELTEMGRTILASYLHFLSKTTKGGVVSISPRRVLNYAIRSGRRELRNIRTSDVVRRRALVSRAITLLLSELVGLGLVMRLERRRPLYIAKTKDLAEIIDALGEIEIEPSQWRAGKKGVEAEVVEATA